ncbi:lipase [Streptococcus pneumoniae]|nr:lipase [Streptococcus pneumoniae]VSM51943.1 lipase [Streptococcus pneumoniae]
MFKKILSLSFGLFLTVLVWAQSILINFEIPLAVLTFILIIGFVFWNNRKNDEQNKTLIWLGLSYILVRAIWFFFSHVILWWLGQILLIILSIGLLIKGLHFSNKNIPIQILKGLFLTFLTVTSLLLTYLTVDSSPVAKLSQSAANTINSFEPQTDFTVTVSEGNQLLENIQYGTELPNSYLDIILPKGDNINSRPTYLFFHGGGFVAGDKMQGDPNQVSEYSASLYHFEEMVKAGYNVVTVNYALASQYSYPTAIKQISDAVAFLEKNAEKYQLNMNEVVIAGSSAGGNLAAEFVTIQANPSYAKEINVTPVMDLSQIKAAVLEVPALDPNRVGKTQRTSIIEDYVFGQAIAAYMRQSVISPDRELYASRNLIDKVTADFPPVFITDGNLGSFMDQSHGYLADIHSEATQTYIKKKISFLEKLTN